MKNFSLPILTIAILAVGFPAIAQEGDFVRVTDAMLENPDPADWLMWRRTHNGWGYSPLDQIDRNNVDRLGLVWTRGLEEGVHEGTPLVHDGVMYMPNPADVIQAMDAATGDFKWEYRREWPEDLTDFLNAPQLNRNIAIYGDLIIDTTGDGYAIGLDARTGELIWETLVSDYRTYPVQHSSGPIVANGRMVSGRNCGLQGPHGCVIVAHDPMTGQKVWRTRTIPGPGEAGDETWGDVPFENRLHVGTWMPPTYDAELGLVYYGTSVTSPAPKFMLGSNDNQYLYHNSTLALDVATGSIRWYYQHLVDHWDLDHPFERLLVDTEVAPDADHVRWINPNVQSGETRRVVTGIPGKTGIVYTLDRETGEFLWARPTVEQTVVSDIDGETGEVTVNPEMLFSGADQQRVVCPSTRGGKNWPAGSYSPLTHTMYFPLQNTCMTVTSISDAPVPGNFYAIRMDTQITPGTDNVGTIQAISVETGETLWQFEQWAAMLSLLTTGGELLIGGDANGRFRAFDQDTGEVLWEVNLGAPVTGYPITYSVAGRQYVAVSTGTSFATPSLNRIAGLNPRVSNSVFVFALPD